MRGSPAEAQATRQVLAYVLEHSLRLLHPFMPFVTEAIWQNLPGVTNGDWQAHTASNAPTAVVSSNALALMVTRWPHNSGRLNTEAEASFGRIQEIVRAIRNVRSEYDVPAPKRIPAAISAGEQLSLIQQNLPVIAALGRLDRRRRASGSRSAGA